MRAVGLVDHVFVRARFAQMAVRRHEGRKAALPACSLHLHFSLPDVLTLTEVKQEDRTEVQPSRDYLLLTFASFVLGWYSQLERLP